MEWACLITCRCCDCVIWFHVFKLNQQTNWCPVAYHRCHAALSWRPASRPADGGGRLSLDSSAAGGRRPEWPGRWPAGTRAQQSPPARRHGPLATGRRKHRHPEVTTCCSVDLVDEAWTGQTCWWPHSTSANGNTHHRAYLRAGSWRLAGIRKTSCQMYQ